MRCSLVLGVIADDRPGLLEALSMVISTHGGEWNDSKMVAMGGKFAGILLVEIPLREMQPFTDALDAFKMQGLSIAVDEVQSPAEQECREFYLELVGQDRPGIVREITLLLAKYDINLESLESHIESASMSGETLFFGTALIHIPEEVDLVLLQESFEELANELMVDIKLRDPILP